MTDLNTTHLDANFTDDPLVTAYALGELEGDDAALFERRAAQNPALCAEIEAIRATALMLREGFVAEPAASLTDSPRLAIMQKPAQEAASLNSPQVFRQRRLMRWVAGGLAAAAMLGLSVTAAIMFGRVDGFGGDVARNAPRPTGGAVARNEVANGDSVTRSSSGMPQNEPKSELSAMAQPSLAGGDEKDVQAAKEVAQPAPPVAAAEITAAPGGMAGLHDEAAASAVVTPKYDQATDRAPGRPAEPTKPAAVPDVGAATGSPPPPASAGTPANTHQQPADPRGSSGAGGRDASAATGPASAAAPATPPGESRPAGRRAGDGAESRDDSRDKSGESLGTTGGLRSSGGEVAQGEAGGVDRFSQERISGMTEDEAAEALKKTQDQARRLEGTRAAADLRRQGELLDQRLREIRETSAEEYARINDNPFIKPVGDAALSTFAADVDTASYSNIRRFLNSGQLPPPDAVRIEEMINYFRYDYAPPSAAEGDAPFSANVEIAAAPWNPEHRLVRVGLRGKDVRMDMRRATSMVFLVDVSGSMNQPAKLPLVKQSLKKLVAELNGDDRLAIVTYQGNAGLVLDSSFVNAENREKIDAAIENMQPGGSTNGAGGINLAYDVARQHFIKGGVNRVLLCTDGDFNVGVSGDDALVALIEEQRKSNVFLSVLGFGTGNFKDSKMEKVSNAGNGNFAYIDSIDEAHKVLVEQMGGTLMTIAKDVKFQVEFNPAKVGAYRLIGYEDRLLKAEDFNNDAKDAGEIGSGHTMTALYEVVPVGKEADALAKNEPAGTVDELEYQRPTTTAPHADADAKASENLLTVKIRFKTPEGDVSELLRFPAKDDGKAVNEASADFRFAAAVAEFGMLLRRSPYRGGATLATTLDRAEGALGEDEQGYRAQFIDMVRKAQRIDGLAK